MLQKWFKKYFPSHDSINNHSELRSLGRYFKHPSLWSINQHSLSRGVSIGLFSAFIPLPFQMLIAATLCILFRANMPIAIAATWITNPFTFVPINFLIYKIGHIVLGRPEINTTHAELYWDFDNISEFWKSFSPWISHLGRAYFVGLPIVALGAALFGYFTIRFIWYINTMIHKYYSEKKSKQ